MARIIQYQSILTGEWRDLVRLYPEADEDNRRGSSLRRFRALQKGGLLVRGGYA